MATFPRFESLAPLVYLATLALVVTVLASAKVVLVPLALAVLFAFVLTPVVKGLERCRLPRVPAVALSVLLALGLLGAFGFVLTQQLNSLAVELPHYTRTIRKKVAALRAEGHGALASVQDAVDQINDGLAKPAGRGEPDPAEHPVTVVAPPESSLDTIRSVLRPIAEPVATAGIVLVLAVFMLVQREDLRNRFLRLMGRGRLSVTTRAMDEAGERISRYLLTQTLINGAFGAVVTAGLLWIGVPYAALWGVAAALLRFVPYVGAFFSMLMPVAVAFVQFEGWGPSIATVGLFLGCDLLTANVLEPIVVGHRTGVSSVALLVSALFWSWLWGPIGLLLSTPITVCLAVLGRHVGQLEFLTVLLGDAPALDPDVVYYQRLLAGDDDEAADVVDEEMRKGTPERVFVDVLVPALVAAKRDRLRGDISEEDARFVLQSTRDIVQRTAEAPAEAAEPAGPCVLGMPARDGADEVALTMLAQTIDRAACRVEVASTTALAAELLERIAHDDPAAVCVMALPPGGLGHARYLCKRLRARFPALPIVLVRPGGVDEPRVAEAGADEVATGLLEARDRILAHLAAASVPALEARPA
jgi:predicted PurR-regulated permease PerM